MLKKKIYSDNFKSNHKKSPFDFTRERKLPFAKMLIIMMRKSMKSLQNVLNETQRELSLLWNEDSDIISASAYTQARRKLDYTAFVELSDSTCKMFYEDGDYARFNGYRVLAVDGSIVTLPYSKDIRESFNTMQVRNQDKNFSKEIVQARASVLYDVLNHIAIEARLDDRSVDERSQAIAHITQTQKDDLIVFDRGYPSYKLFATMINSAEADFLMRIRKNSFKEARYLFEKPLTDNDIVLTITPSTKTLKKSIKAEKLPLQIKIRFIQVILDTGEIEVLATSVLDTTKLDTESFKHLYHLRWKIETFYDIIKNRLNLENFTGLSTLAVRQDFFATIFISNYESVLIYDANKELKTKETQHKQKVNHAISFNVIKNRCFDIFYSDIDIETLLAEMEKLFFTNPTLIRNNRSAPRNDYEKTKHMRHALNYHKRKKKIVF